MKCVKLLRDRAVFVGKSKGVNTGRTRENLSTSWLIKNHFGLSNLNKCMNNLNKWVKFPPSSSSLKHLLNKKKETIDLTLDVKDAGVEVHLQDRNGRGTSVSPSSTFYNQGFNPYCSSFSLANACKFLGLGKRANTLLNDSKDIYQGSKRYEGDPFDNTVQCLQMCKHFKIVPLDTDSWDSIMHQSPNMKLVQLCSAPVGEQFHNPSHHDNTHVVSIVRDKLFDSNKHQPVTLSEKSLNSCCLGGDRYVLHHVSRVVEFEPTKIMKRVLKKLKNK